MQRVHFIIVLILLRIIFPINEGTPVNNGLFLNYLIGILIPFMFLITFLIREARISYFEYENEVGKKLIEDIHISSADKITESYIKRFTPFVEGMYIKMIKHGIHSIHAVPRLLCD